MAKFFHADRVIDYRMVLTSLDRDVVLLQSSQNVPPASESITFFDFWSPVMETLKSAEGDPGRVLICQWFASGRETVKMARDLCGLCGTLGLSSLYVVACGDAVEVVEAIEGFQPDLIAKKLLIVNEVSRAEDLVQPIRAFLQI